MKCLISAAGYATRLYPLAENFPKPLLKMGGKRFDVGNLENYNKIKGEYKGITVC